ncbi:Glycerol-3-phosphate dehydrogenase [NAD(P)+] [Planctomycetes bacterium Poly30]|uniref:Glycerol-3-phosphate dehydrogenase [NAD(P)+] n=1 Tax=Saltatorellus ferox TaxID=2528018 RepID=A0A518ENM5_9BACT|nr:Glycerol-3-phosphate dehydrogenase [NAD(P)+] [Planctomycetes bacterium Poly30]
MTTANDAGIRKALVIGDGSWGTALALRLASNSIETTLWSAFPEQAKRIGDARENVKFLPGIRFPDNLHTSADPFGASEGVDLVVSVVPTQYVAQVAARFEDALRGDLPIVTASKGLEIDTFRTPSQILRRVLGERTICVLTGPSHAEEVARDLPASVVAGCEDEDFARLVQTAFNGETFRVYTTPDGYGAELAGALKNVIAIAAGICDGLGLGDNAKSALLTRGIVEIARFGRARGADVRTFFGLAGLGDLVTTCMSQHSRNRAVGEAIGRGKTLQQVLDEMSMVAEGVWTTKALFGPEANEDLVSMPIAEQVHAVLFEGKDPREAVLDLMRREPTGEMDGLFEGLDA